MNEIEQDGIPIMNYLKIFFRRKEIIIIATIIGLVTGVCASLLLPKQYRSSTVILVEEGKTDNPLFNRLAVSTTVQQRLSTIRESMLGWNSLVKLVKRLNLDKDIKTTKQFEALISKIRRNININLRSRNILALTYEGVDPVNTQAVVKNITDIFIERNIEVQNQETRDAISFIEEQLRVYKGKIKSAEIAQMEDDLDELLVDSTEKHPLVKQLRERLDKKKDELQRENLEFTRAEQIKFESNTTLVDSIKNALDALEVEAKRDVVGEEGKGDKDMYKFFLLEKLDKVVARDAQVNENIYNMLLQRLETAKITQRLQSSKEGTRYTIIEPPRIPLDPFKPNIFIVTMAGIFFGAFVGFCLVAALEFLDKSFIDVEEAKEFLGVPLLGAISKINTEETIRQERDKKRWIYSLTCVAGVVAVVVTVVISNFLK